MGELNMKDVYILAIESSCDETSIAIVKNGCEVVAITILTQMYTCKLWRGSTRNSIKNAYRKYYNGT